MSHGKTSLAGITRQEIAIALAKEKQPLVRKRLRAIQKILEGKSVAHAARAVKVDEVSVNNWLVRARLWGCAALVHDGRGKHRRARMSLEDVRIAREEIAAALKRRPHWLLMLRLRALDMVLAGEPIERAAELAHVQPQRVQKWLGLVANRGIVHALERWESRARPRKLEADAMALREAAEKQMNPRIRKRILALACVADGMSVHDASANTGISHSVIYGWIERIRENGIAVLRNRNTGRPPKLTVPQLQQLRSEILSRPDMSYPELRDLAQDKFGVRYTQRGLALLLKNKLGIAWIAGTFQAA